MNHLDLFSGIGGFSLAAQWVWDDEHNIVSFVEIDQFCQKVLKKHWPAVPIHDDIRTLDYETVMAYAARTDAGSRERITESQKPINGQSAQLLSNTSGRGRTSETRNNHTTIDLLTGGFPCQPFSVAGKQRGAADDRALWPEMYRIIRECKPRWIIGENVNGIIRMELDNCLADLENEGYTTEQFIIPACAVDAPHRRDRVWIVGHSKELFGDGGEHNGSSDKESTRTVSEFGNTGGSQDVADASTQRLPESTQTGAGCIQSQIESSERSQSGRGMSENGRNWLPEPDVGRVASGIPNRVDRLKSLGNAIVPQVVVPIMQAIKQCDRPEIDQGRL
jgi:DNA (cytosine-5)-methyltransferase 1